MIDPAGYLHCSCGRTHFTTSEAFYCLPARKNYQRLSPLAQAICRMRWGRIFYNGR